MTVALLLYTLSVLILVLGLGAAVWFLTHHAFALHERLARLEAGRDGSEALEALPILERGGLPASQSPEVKALLGNLADVHVRMLLEYEQLNRLTLDLKCQGKFNPDEFFKLISEHARKIDAARKQYVLAVKARLLDWQFLALVPRGAQMQETLQTFQASIAGAATAAAMGSNYQALADALVQRLESLDTTLAEYRTLEHRKAAMTVFNQNAFENAAKELEGVVQTLERIGAGGGGMQKIARLAMRLKEGAMEVFELRKAPVQPAPMGKLQAAVA
jgi:hypothetical protein